MELPEMFDYIADLVADAAHNADVGTDGSGGDTSGKDDEQAFELRKIELVSRGRLVLDIIEAQIVHDLRSAMPQVSYGDIASAQGISKQASRIRHAKLEQILKVHQLDGRRHSMSKTIVSAKHRRAARPTRQARRATT